MPVAPDPTPQTGIVLEHPALAAMPSPVFHRADSDGAAIVTLPMGNGAQGTGLSVTLPALRRQLGIDESSADGRMLSAIAESLNFVSALRTGDTLPAEVKTGDASWSADPTHLLRAATRLRLRLVAWHHHGPLESGSRMDALLDRLANDPQLPHLVTAALRRSQHELRLPTPEALVTLVDAMAWELSFIEALRDRLHLRLQAIAGTIAAATNGRRNDRQKGDMQIQVRRLLHAAIAQVGQRFAKLDARCTDVIPMLHDPPSFRAFIRAERDWLYRIQRALEPMMTQWDNAPRSMDDAGMAARQPGLRPASALSAVAWANPPSARHSTGNTTSPSRRPPWPASPNPSAPTSPGARATASPCAAATCPTRSSAT